MVGYDRVEKNMGGSIGGRVRGEMPEIGFQYSQRIQLYLLYMDLKFKWNLIWREHYGVFLYWSYSRK